MKSIGETSHTVTALGTKLTLAELEHFAATLRRLGAGDQATITARIKWGGGVRQMIGTVTDGNRADASRP